MPDYVKHVTAERARLRHPAFANNTNRAIALEILQKQPGIAGIKQGPESFLLFFEADASLDQICKALEEKIPEIACERKDRPKAAGKRPKNPYRKDILRTYLASGVTTVSLAVMGFYHWHKIAAWIFTAFAVHHVWVRRKAL